MQGEDLCAYRSRINLLNLQIHLQHGLLTRYTKLRVAHALGIPVMFSSLLRVSNPDMHHGMCVTHVPWCMSGSLTSGSLWSQWRVKCSRHSRCMRNPEFYVSGKRPIDLAKQTSVQYHWQSPTVTEWENQSWFAACVQWLDSSVSGGIFRLECLHDKFAPYMNTRFRLFFTFNRFVSMGTLPFYHPIHDTYIYIHTRYVIVPWCLQYDFSPYDAIWQMVIVGMGPNISFVIVTLFSQMTFLHEYTMYMFIYGKTGKSRSPIWRDTITPTIFKLIQSIRNEISSFKNIHLKM